MRRKDVPSTVESGRVISKLVDNLLHLESGGEGLDQLKKGGKRRIGRKGQRRDFDNRERMQGGSKVLLDVPQ